MGSHTLGIDQLAARTGRAVAAATAVARDQGLTVNSAKVLHEAFSVVVHLAPSPVVARVPVVLPPGLDAGAQRQRQTRELSVATWLARSGQPIVQPSPLVPPYPLSRDGFSITLWQLVAVDSATPADWFANAALVADLHATLGHYPGDLPFLAPLVNTVPSCLEFLAQNPGLLAPADLDRGHREWTALAPMLSSIEGFASAFPAASVQPIHGDAPYYNLVHTLAGPLHADFEDVTIGPPELDLALAGAAGVSAYNAVASSTGLRPLDPVVLRVMEAARMLQLVSCFALVPQLPMLAEALAPMCELWRTMPLAGGVDNRS